MSAGAPAGAGLRVQKWAEAFDEWAFRMHGVMSSCDHTPEGEALALIADEEQSELVADARELAALARFHAMHDEVSPEDRARIAALVRQVRRMSDHKHDGSVAAVFMNHVGNVLRCTCGLSYTAGHTCPGARPFCASGVHKWVRVYGFPSGPWDQCDNCGRWNQ